jgi:hypothetical protein
MFDIVHNLMSYFVLIRGAALSTLPLVLNIRALIVKCSQKIMVLPSSPIPSEVQPQDVPVNVEAHDGKMSIY